MGRRDEKVAIETIDVQLCLGDCALFGLSNEIEIVFGSASYFDHFRGINTLSLGFLK